jgi:DNA-3-methyladenine glycosylase
VALLGQEFFQRETLQVARALLGQEIRRGEVVLRITEVEAYRWPHDSANHGWSGKTKRNAAMWGPPGHAYVYLCYGLHNLLNFVTQKEGEAAAVLIRAAEPLRGLDLIQQRRGGKSGPVLLTGPGKIGQALGLDTSWSGHPLFEKGNLEVHRGPEVTHVIAGPRVGIDFCEPKDRDAPWRLACADTPWVSHRSTLGA